MQRGAQATAVDILIASDHYWDTVTGNIVQADGGQVAVSNKFGWLVSGPTKNTGGISSTCVSTSLIIESPDVTEVEPSFEFDLSVELRYFWEVESLGITVESAVKDSLEFPKYTKFDWTLG